MTFHSTSLKCGFLSSDSALATQWFVSRPDEVLASKLRDEDPWPPNSNTARVFLLMYALAVKAQKIKKNTL